MSMTVIFGVLRHVLTALGGGLVSQGLLTNGDVETGIGAVLTLAGLVASVLSKRQADDTLRRS